MDDSTVLDSASKNVTDTSPGGFSPMEISFLATGCVFAVVVVVGFIYFLIFNTQMSSMSLSGSRGGGGGAGGGGRKTQTHFTLFNPKGGGGGGGRGGSMKGGLWHFLINHILRASLSHILNPTPCSQSVLYCLIISYSMSNYRMSMQKVLG